MHLINQARRQILTNSRHAAADSHVLAVRGFSGLVQCGLESLRYEVKRRAALHDQGSAWIVRQYENRGVIRRSISPPAFPGITFPRSANRTEHVSAQNPSADVFERPRSEVIVDAVPAV